MFDRPKLEHAPVSDPVAPRRKVSREGLVLIKSLEGFQPRAWRRPDGRWAIGYGHSRSAREGLTVSEPDAELLLQYDLLPVVAALNDRVSRPLNQHQFDALASFALSVGVDAFVASDVLAALNAEGPEGAARALAARTEVDPALARAGRRRHAEWALFGTDPDAPVTVAALLAAPAPPVATTASTEAQADADVDADLVAPPAASEHAPETSAAPAAPGRAADALPDETPAAAPIAPAPPAFTLRYAAAVSHLLGEAPTIAAPAAPAEPAPTPVDAAAPALEPERDAPAPTPQVADVAPSTTPPPASEPAPLAEAGPVAETESSSPPPAAPEVDRQAVLAELMRRQMSPFAIQVRGPLPPLGRPAEPPTPAPKLRPPVAASGPMTAVLAGPLPLPAPVTEAEPVATVTAPVTPVDVAVDVATEAATPPPRTEREATPVAPLILTPPPSVEPDVQRPVWAPEERHPQTRSLETDLFSEDELAADIGLGPVLRHEIIETPGRRFDLGQLGAYAGMGAVGLVSLGAAVPAAQALLDEGAGPSGETLLVFAALALIGAGCSGISGFNLWRLWREAHARNEPVRDA